MRTRFPTHVLMKKNYFNGPIGLTYIPTLFLNLLTLGICLFFASSAWAQQICGPVRTLYQTVGDTSIGATKIYKYNNFQQSYDYITTLQGPANDPTSAESASNSAYNKTTKYMYSSDQESDASKLVVRVYDPNNNFEFKGKITITGANATFNNTLFSFGDKLGYVNRSTLVQFDVGSITSYPATVTATSTVVTGVFITAADYALIDDKIYGVTDSNELVIIDLTTNVRSKRTLTIQNTLDNLPLSSGYGACWQDKNNNFYAFNNGSGGIYKIKDIASLTASGNVIMEKVLIANPSGLNDGFGCEVAPDPLDWDEDGVSLSLIHI